MTSVLGFTGTRRGLTQAQTDQLRFVVPTLPDRFLHGGAPGADEQVDNWIVRCGLPLDRIEVYPCTEERLTHWRSFVRRVPRQMPRIVYDVQPPLVRNALIVKRATRTLAMPGEMTEVVRSGTWYTIRRARLFRVPLVIVFPDGTIRVEDPAPAEPLPDLLGVERR